LSEELDIMRDFVQREREREREREKGVEMLLLSNALMYVIESTLVGACDVVVGLYM
jgi:hypothetical protein